MVPSIDTHDSRREPRKLGERTLLDMEKDASDLLVFARKQGYLESKLKYVGDFPVVVLRPRFYVFFNTSGYEIEYPEGGTTFTYKFSDVMSRVRERVQTPSWGDEEVGMMEINLTPTYDDVYNLLIGSRTQNYKYNGYLGEKWTRVKDNQFNGGEYSITVKCTPNALLFRIKGPYLTSEPYGELRGRVSGAGRAEQLQGLAARLDFIAENIGKTRARARKDLLKLMKYPAGFGGYEM
jgi:hypothetical protein